MWNCPAFAIKVRPVGLPQDSEVYAQITLIVKVCHSLNPPSITPCHFPNASAQHQAWGLSLSSPLTAPGQTVWPHKMDGSIPPPTLARPRP